METDSCVVMLSKKELIRLEMIIVDGDKDDALKFLRELREKTEATTIKGIRSHLDGERYPA